MPLNAKALFEFVNDWMRSRQDPTQTEYENYTRQLGALTGLTALQRDALKNFAEFGKKLSFPVDTDRYRDNHARLERSEFRAYRPETPSLPWTLWETADGNKIVTSKSWYKDGVFYEHTDLPQLLWVQEAGFHAYESVFGPIQVITPTGFLTSMEVLQVPELEVLQWGLGVSV